MIAEIDAFFPEIESQMEMTLRSVLEIFELSPSPCPKGQNNFNYAEKIFFEISLLLMRVILIFIHIFVDINNYFIFLSHLLLRTTFTVTWNLQTNIL